LTFPESEVRRPVLATLVRRFDVEPNIRRADVEEHRGWILCEVDGEAGQVDAALDWLRGHLGAGEVVLVKASRMARLDEVAAALT